MSFPVPAFAFAPHVFARMRGTARAAGLSAVLTKQGDCRLYIDGAPHTLGQPHALADRPGRFWIVVLFDHERPGTATVMGKCTSFRAVCEFVKPILVIADAAKRLGAAV